MPHVLFDLAADGLCAIIVQVVRQLLEKVFTVQSILPPTNWMGQQGARIHVFSSYNRPMRTLTLALFLAVSMAAAQTGPLEPAELEKALPKSQYLEGENIPTQARNSGGLRLAGGGRLIAALLDTSGYSSQIQTKYLGMLVTERSLELGTSTVPPGAYGFGKRDTDLLLYNTAGRNVAGIRLVRDEALSPARPMQLAVRHGGIRLYVGKEYVVFWAKQSPTDETGFLPLLTGKDKSGWRQAAPGEFQLLEGAVVSSGGMGMLWYEKEKYKDFTLRLEWRVNTSHDNSGIFLRIPEASDDPWFAVNHSYEIQIQDDRDPEHRTGSNYGFVPSITLASRPAGEWNSYEITVVGQQYVIRLNGETVCEFTGNRALEGYIGLQNHDDKSKVSFRNVRIKKL